MNMYFVENFSEGDCDGQSVAMRKRFKFTKLDEADFIFCASVMKMREAMVAKANSHIPLVIYCWDYYLFAHDGRHKGWEWKHYAQFMKDADLVLVPSSGQQLRLKELLGIDSVVVKSGITTYDLPIIDGDFILDPLRYYPEEQRTWAEQAAEKLGIPIIHSEHQYKKEDFKKLVASCTFLTCCVPEASTGSLTISEGLWLGKPSLLSNSPYMGGKDYLKDYATYFQWDDFDDLVAKMKDMWENRRKLDLEEVRSYMRKELAHDKMISDMYEAIHNHIKTHRREV
jgi:hypothetical protein